METKDLRIGNYISYLGEPQEVLGMDKTQVYIKPFNFVLFLDTDEIEPIPLTEEWLLNFGFEEISFTQDKDRDWYKMFEIDDTSEVVSLNYYTKTNYCRFNFDIGYGNKYVDLHYVHQLQNIYFALTGDELKLI